MIDYIITFIFIIIFIATYIIMYHIGYNKGFENGWKDGEKGTLIATYNTLNELLKEETIVTEQVMYALDVIVKNRVGDKNDK